MGNTDLIYGSELNLKATELRLGLPGTTDEEHQELAVSSAKCNKRAFESNKSDDETYPSTKSQIVGWPPVRSNRMKNSQTNKKESAIYIKVSMDGAAYLRKIDLKMYRDYSELLRALENMFKFKAGEYSEREGYKGSEFVPTYEDKDGDLMLVGDVPWDMFMGSCKRLRIMRGSEARGLGCGV